MSETIIVRSDQSVVIDHNTGVKHQREYSLGFDQMAYAFVGAVSTIPLFLGVLTIVLGWDPWLLIPFVALSAFMWSAIYVSRGR